MPKLFDFFTGNHAKSANEATFGAYKAGADAARTGALGAIGTGRDNANAALNFGYGDAVRNIQGAINQGWDVANQVSTERKASINTGADAALGASRGALQTIADLYNPYIRSGQAAQTLYDQALGLGPTGAAGAREFYNQYATVDPMRGFKDEQILRAIGNQTNAVGQFGARGGLASTRALNESYDRDLQTYLSRLEGQAGRGGQYAGQLAGFTNDAGNREAGIEMNRGSALSGIFADHGNTLNRLITQNPLATGQLSQHLGDARAQLETNYGNNVAGIESGYHQGVAGAKGAQFQGDAAAGTAGMNNILKAGTAAAQMAMGMPPTALMGGQQQPGQQQYQQQQSPLGQLWNYFSPGQSLGTGINQTAQNQWGYL